MLQNESLLAKDRLRYSRERARRKLAKFGKNYKLHQTTFEFEFGKVRSDNALFVAKIQFHCENTCFNAEVIFS